MSKFYHNYAPISTGFAVIVEYIFLMKTVYVEDLFALNACIDYFLLLSAARVCGLPLRRGRFALAAALGGLWCCAALSPSLAWLNTAVMKPVPALAMSLLAFGREPKLWRSFGVFVGLSAMFGGAVFAAGLWRGTWQAGGPLVRLDLRVLLLSFALCWAGVSLVFRRALPRAQRQTHEILVCHGGHQVRFRALRDTGNELTDPLTGRSVLVAEAGALEALFPPAQARSLSLDAVTAVGQLEGFRLVPYRGLGEGGGLLACFRPEKLYVDGRPRDDLLAAVTPAPLSRDGSYQALI